MKIDLAKANAAIDEYLALLQNPKKFPWQISSLYFVKTLLEKHGVIPSWRKLDLTDHCVLFIACIIACDRVREVSRIEVERRAVRTGKSLQKTLNQWRKNQGRTPYYQRIEKHLADTVS